MSYFREDVETELIHARSKYRPMASAHEGWAVLREEMQEVVDERLWEEVKKKPTKRDISAIYNELVQVAAMAQRMAEDIVLSGKAREI